MGRGDQTRAAAAALGSGGVVTTAQLRAGGVSPRLAEREAEAGRWRWLARGTYATHDRPVTVGLLVRAAQAYVDAPCVVTGSLVLHELDLPWTDRPTSIHVLVDDHVRRRSSGLITVSRTDGLDALDTWTRYGARLTPIDRAVIDSARAAASLRGARAVVLGAVAKGCAHPVELLAILDGGRRNGSAHTRRAIVDAARGCASPPEAELVDALVPLGVPFLVNPEIWVDGVLLGRADIWVLGTAVGGEVESAEWHEGDEKVGSTYDRHERFVGAALDLVHLSVARLRPDATEAARHLLRRAVAGPPVPPGLVVVPRGPVLGTRRRA